jgi:hypothetical protein
MLAVWSWRIIRDEELRAAQDIIEQAISDAQAKLGGIRKSSQGQRRGGPDDCPGLPKYNLSGTEQYLAELAKQAAEVQRKINAILKP